jgi:flagellar biosynthesis anti-sigma factor FlgM
MKITDLFKSSSLSGQSQTSQAERAAERAAKNAERAAAKPRPGEDTVSISAQARQFQQISSILSEDEAASGDRVSALKAQVESGSYSVDSRDVAKSLGAFARDVEI